MQRSLSTFPLNNNIFSKLSSVGFSVVSDIIDLKACELSKELGVTTDEALSLLLLVKESLKKSKSSFYSIERSKTALQILQQDRLNITTFSHDIDGLFDGGIPLGKLTEVCGCPGIGKTQLCFQLAIDVQIPQCCGGMDGEAIFIDTEGSFIVDRVFEIAKATTLHCQSLFSDAGVSSSDDETMKSFHVENILARIHYFRCFDYVQLVALMYTLGEFLKNKKVKLIIIDSIAHVFRQDFDDFQLRNRLLSTISQLLNKYCSDHQLAVSHVNGYSPSYAEAL